MSPTTTTTFFTDVWVCNPTRTYPTHITPPFFPFGSFSVVPSERARFTTSVYLDWLISIGLLRISFALTAPVAAVIGVRATLVGAGLVGAAITLAALFLPGMRDIEESGSHPGGAVRPFAESAAR